MKESSASGSRKITGPWEIPALAAPVRSSTMTGDRPTATLPRLQKIRKVPGSWNSGILVFMQYNQMPGGEIAALPKPSVDTGAGLERLLTLICNADSIFETDVLLGLIAEVEKLAGTRYDPGNHRRAAPFRVIADHLRCLAFAIADGVQPSNVDRGYVLRKVLRRAVRYGRQLGLKEPFLAKMLPRLTDLMGDHFTELKTSQSRIAEILTLEEESFLRTLKRGGNLLNQTIERAKEHGNHITGDDAFKLKDTYGMPLEEITLLAKDAGLDVDLKRYEELEEDARERSRAVHKKAQQVAETSIFEDFSKEHSPTQFLGYDHTSAEGKVTALIADGKFTNRLEEGQEGTVILDRTPFYAEMGGQVGDTGEIIGKNSFFKVQDTQSPFKGVTAHIGFQKRGTLTVGDTAEASIDAKRRQAIANNHTATHLLHGALQHVLGEHVKQAGSVVDAVRLRFDFSHHKALSDEEIREIEDWINQKIRENHSVTSYEIHYEEAQKRQDIKQFFGDKYDSVVRVVDIQPTKELCGGTHTNRSGNIGLLKIVSEKSIAQGVRRIEAVTGKEAEEFARSTDNLLRDIADMLKTSPPKLKTRLEKLVQENQELSQELKHMHQQSRGLLIDSLLEKKQLISDVPCIISEADVDTKELRPLAEELLQKLSSGLVVLGCRSDGKGHLIVRISDDFVKKGLDAKKLISELAPIIEGSGGGKPSGAQAGGKNPKKLSEALENVKKLL